MIKIAFSLLAENPPFMPKELRLCHIVGRGLNEHFLPYPTHPGESIVINCFYWYFNRGVFSTEILALEKCLVISYQIHCWRDPPKGLQGKTGFRYDFPNYLPITRTISLSSHTAIYKPSQIFHGSRRDGLHGVFLCVCVSICDIWYSF